MAPFKEAEEDEADPTMDEGDFAPDEGTYALAQEHMQYGGVDANGNGAYYGGLKGGSITLRLRGGQVSCKPMCQINSHDRLMFYNVCVPGLRRR